VIVGNYLFAILSVTVVGLVGIIVRNGIIMFDYLEKLRREQQMSVREAAFEAGRRRMRPIFLTSAAASMGVLPMILSRSLFWSPMGAVVFFGTMISMILVVTVLPVAYWMLFKELRTKS
jgi:multidrug efflux pump subunit AcrB